MKFESAFVLLILFASSRPARAMSPATELTIKDGLHLLYNLDYKEARARVRQLIVQEPENPYGYLFEASIIWWQADNEYGLFMDTPTLEGLFEDDIALTLDKGSAALKAMADPHEQAEVHFAMGMALGVRGQWSMLRHRWIKAYFEGRKAMKHLHACLKLDPNFYDPYLGIGIYDYQADRLPKVLKLSALLMIHGNAERGLEEMQSAMDHGRFVSSQAAEFMATLYAINEHDYAKALPLTQVLRDRFPESPYFRILEAILLRQLDDIDGSYKAAIPVLDRVTEDPDLVHRKLLSILCGLGRDTCLGPSQVASAIEWLTHGIETEDGLPAARTTLLYFLRGVAFDMQDNREQALANYRQCLGGPDVGGIQEMARRCAAIACTREEVMSKLKSMSLGDYTNANALERPN